MARNVAAETSKFKNINSVILAEKTTRAAKRDAAKAAAAAHTNLTSQMIKEFEQQEAHVVKPILIQSLTKTCSYLIQKVGVLALDPERYRAAGAAKLVEQGGSGDASRNFLMTMLQGQMNRPHWC